MSNNTDFPRDLVEQCLLSCHRGSGNDNGRNPGELLELVLSVLVDMQDSINNQESTFLLSLETLHSLWAQWHEKETGVLLDNDSSNISNSNNQSSTPSLPCIMYRILTNDHRPHLVASIQRHKEHPPGTTNEAHQWYLALQLIALLLQHDTMTALEVHSVALQAMTMLPKPHPSLRRSQAHNHSFLLGTLLLLLATWSLQQCHQQILQAGPNLRFKRIKSLVLETIQLYQVHALTVQSSSNSYPNDDDDDDDDDDDTDEMEVAEEGDDGFSSIRSCLCILAVPLWTRHIVPTAMALWQELPDTVSSPPCVLWTALTTSVASQLGVLLLPLQQPHDSWEEIYSSLLDTLPNECWPSLVLGHSWRVACYQQQNQRLPIKEERRIDRLDWWTLRRHDSQKYDDDDDDDDTPPDEYETMDTHWNELGVALLAWRAWQDRPQVYRPLFQWKLWFPHVAILMNHNPDQQQVRQQQQIQLCSNSHLELTLQGISLLQALMSIMPQHTLFLSNSFTSARRNASTTGTPTGRATNNQPDHPVGTFQLLLNCIVAVTTQQQPSTSTRRLPNAMTLFQLCKDLLAKYTPSTQWEIVGVHLLPCCPHPGLKPKLLDLLRPLLALHDKSIQGTQRRLCQELETILSQELDRFVRVTSREGKIEGLQNVEEFIDHSEYLVSACALLHLGWRNRPWEDVSRHPIGIPLHLQDEAIAAPTLGDVGQAIRDQLNAWDKDQRDGNKRPTEPPDQHFRLNLLEMAIEQIRDLP